MTWGWFSRRLASVVIVLLCCSAATYALMDALPGSTAAAILGTNATPETIAVVEQDLQLDRPLPVRYGVWLGRAVRGDLGVSYQTGEVVSEVIRDRVPTSVELLVLTQLLAVGIALPASMVAARREHSRFDRTASLWSFGMVATPHFALGIVLLILFAEKLHWFPVAQYTRLGDGVGANLRSLVLPVITLGLPLSGIYFRLLRADLIATLRSDHIAFARSLGFSERRVLLSRALRPSSLTLVSVVGLNTATLLGGAVIVERLFSLPGLGGMVFEAVQKRDIVKVQAATLAIALIYVLVNLAVDVALTTLDPRIRLGRSAG